MFETILNKKKNEFSTDFPAEHDLYEPIVLISNVMKS